jgi:uncharacterized membrane protein
MKNAFLFLSVVSIALMAGLFYAWSIAVMPGLKKLPDREFILAMQAMNRAIQNPFFFVCFFGSIIFLTISCFLQYQQPFTTGYYLLLASTVLYLIGILGVTIFGNIPLNNILEGFEVKDASPEALTNVRIAFENKWNDLNHIRSISVFLSLCAIVGAVLLRKYR